jgi:oligopeptide/dipeptide ABC transporter ATP-binding protein
MLAKPTAWVKAVDGVSFSVRKGESFGIVGESGCGKSTLGQMVVRLLEPTGGNVLFKGADITHLSRHDLRPFRQKIQIIFQDPYSSLDPRMTVTSIITEPLFAQGKPSKAHRRKVAAGLMEKVGLRPDDQKKYPHEFSGGQRQRIGIARALCVRPELIVADEPVSALDVSIQAQVINLMEDLKDAFDLSYIFISHDIGVVEHICDRIAVMYLGSLVEVGPTESIISSPFHPYTAALLSAIPRADPHHRIRPAAMEGDVPNPINPPSGCPFHPRCDHTFDRCRTDKPKLIDVTDKHTVACWLNDGMGIKKI